MDLRGADQLFVEDLRLAEACLAGDAKALDALEALLTKARSALSRTMGSPALVTEATQLLREKLLMGGTGTPKLAAYSGQGPLLAWLRASLVRTVLNLQRQKPLEVLADHQLIEELSPPVQQDAELAYLKARYRAQFSAAFSAALQALPARERNVLRLHVGDRMSMEQIGRAYGVNKSTVSRWVDAARAQLLTSTRERLARSVGVDRAELDSLMRALVSQLGVSVGGRR